MKKLLKKGISLLLTVTCIAQASISVFAAENKKEYVSDVVISYGNTESEAEDWLTKNGYQYVDCDLNAGADDTFSTKRSVYMGYKTTNDPEKAITDMKLMNMNGGYNVQDYQVLLQNEKDNIQSFMSGLITVLNEYRENYAKGSGKAAAAYAQLNMFYDEDTGMNMGDLLLQKIKEEYTDQEFSALSEEEQKKHADMTTILMQGNSDVVLTIRQILATAADTSDTLWLERVNGSAGYDDLLDQLIQEKGMSPDQAEKELAKQYDQTAGLLAEKAEGFKEYMADYIKDGITPTSSEKELNAYTEKLSDAEKAEWSLKSSYYTTLSETSLSDGTSLWDLLLSEDYDLSGDDKVLLYPIAAVLSEGQKNSLEMLTFAQILSMGMCDDASYSTAVESADIDENKSAVSVFDGIDRSVYTGEVALTGDAYKLQNSSEDADYSKHWFTDGLSKTTKLLAVATAVTITATVVSFVASSMIHKVADQSKVIMEAARTDWLNAVHSPKYVSQEEISKLCDEFQALRETTGNQYFWAGVFKYAGIGLTVASIVLSAYTIWNTYTDLKAYYNADFTPIPLWMVDQSVNEKGKKVFTYYKAAQCNRSEGGFLTDNNQILGVSGDLNGDVGLQWVALYTTKDKSAGDPVTPEFITQYGKSSIPGEYTALSIFCEKTAQNLTNKKAGYTYNDKKNGIYLFYNTDKSAFAGSTVTTGTWIAIAGVVLILCLAVFAVIRRRKKSVTAKASE